MSRVKIFLFFCLKAYFVNEKAEVFKVLNDKGEFVGIKVEYKDKMGTAEEYSYPQGVPHHITTVKYILAGAKATLLSINSGVPIEQLPNKLKQIIAELKA